MYHKSEGINTGRMLSKIYLPKKTSEQRPGSKQQTREAKENEEDISSWKGNDEQRI